MRQVGKIDYVERGHMLGAKPPKHMCTSCFRIFSKRYEGKWREGGGSTQRCTCGNEELVRLDPSIPIPRRKANSKKWKEFFDRNFLSAKAKVYYQRFKMVK